MLYYRGGVWWDKISIRIKGNASGMRAECERKKGNDGCTHIYLTLYIYTYLTYTHTVLSFFLSFYISIPYLIRKNHQQIFFLFILI